jgi:hypothetical protein
MYTHTYSHTQLLEWAWNALKKAPRPSLPLPDILAAIAPNVLNNQVSDPQCMADLARKTDAWEKRKNTDGVNGEEDDVPYVKPGRYENLVE